MSRVLIIGAGGVSSVTVKKCARLPEMFDEILSRLHFTESQRHQLRGLLVRVDAMEIDVDFWKG